MKITDEEKRIKIAEACGWKFCAPNPSWPTPYWTNPVTKELSVFAQLPDYLNDLNAMHEAEKILTTTEQQNLYYQNIAAITWECEEVAHRQVVFNQLTATAAQRAEAFGRTLNLWTE